MKYKTGDKPGAGRYRCDNCGYVVRITSDAEALPACPNCGQTGRLTERQGRQQVRRAAGPAGAAMTTKTSAYGRNQGVW